MRNPNWDKATDYRPAYLDEIAIQEGNDDLATAARRALAGSASVCCDTSQPPAQVIKQAIQHDKDQVLFAPAGGVHYVSFNTNGQAVRQHQRPQGDHRRVGPRGAAPDHAAARCRAPSPPAGCRPGCRVKEAGGLKQDADLDFLANPKGDPAVAKKYMLAAKQQDPSLPIDADGKWTGGEKVLSIAGNADPNKKTARSSRTRSSSSASS